LVPRSKLEDRRADELCLFDKPKPLSMFSIAVTFSLLASNTASKLRSVLLPSDLACERTLEEIEVPDDKH